MKPRGRRKELCPRGVLPACAVEGASLAQVVREWMLVE